MSDSTAKLPPAWRVARLDEVCEIIQGQSPPGDTYNSDGRGMPFFQGKTEFGELFPKAAKWCTAPTKIAKIDDVLISIRAPVGPTNLCPEEACIGRGLAALRPLEGIPSRYILYAVRNNVRELADKATGSTFEAISGKQLRAHSIPIARPEEQRRIVAEIEKQFTRLDAGVASLKRVQSALKSYRASVLRAACEGRLVPTEAELARPVGSHYEHASDLLTRILRKRRAEWEATQLAKYQAAGKVPKDASWKEKYKPPLAPDLASHQHDELPEGWTWASWDQVGFSQNGRPFPSYEYQPSGFKLPRPGNLYLSGKVGWTTANTRSLPQRWADANPDLVVGSRELVMNLTAQSLKDEFLGRVCLTEHGEKCLLNQRLARLTPVLVPPEYVLYLLKSWRFRRFVDGLNTGSLIQHMFTSQLARFTFPLPPISEQQRIIAEVDCRLSVIEELEAVVAANLKRAERLRQSILHSAFSGSLDP
jgi:type I restriction enzyme S subunit